MLRSKGLGVVEEVPHVPQYPLLEAETKKKRTQKQGQNRRSGTGSGTKQLQFTVNGSRSAKSLRFSRGNGSTSSPPRHLSGNVNGRLDHDNLQQGISQTTKLLQSLGGEKQQLHEFRNRNILFNSQVDGIEEYHSTMSGHTGKNTVAGTASISSATYASSNDDTYNSVITRDFPPDIHSSPEWVGALLMGWSEKEKSKRWNVGRPQANDEYKRFIDIETKFLDHGEREKSMLLHSFKDYESMSNQMRSQSIPAPADCTAFSRNRHRATKTIAKNTRGNWNPVNNAVPDGHPKSQPYLSRRQFDLDPSKIPSKAPHANPFKNTLDKKKVRYAHCIGGVGAPGDW